MALIKLLLDLPSELADSAAQLLIELGAGGVEEQSGERGARLIVYGDDERVVRALSERARAALADHGLSEAEGALSIRVEVDNDSDWDTAWTRHLSPQAITPHWIVQPVWDTTPPPHGMRSILIRPTLAFGDGAHVTTRLAARAVEQFCLALPGARVLDVGTGTGVLSIVAALSGASTVVALDVDGVALAAARENAALNGVRDAIRFEDAASELSAKFDLIVANLLPRDLLGEAERLALRAVDCRELVVTGFLADQVEGIEGRFAELGLVHAGRVDEDGWSLIVLQRSSA